MNSMDKASLERLKRMTDVQSSLIRDASDENEYTKLRLAALEGRMDEVEQRLNAVEKEVDGIKVIVSGQQIKNQK